MVVSSMKTLLIYLNLVIIRFKSQTIYKKSFIFEIIAYFLQMASGIGAIYFIFCQTNNISNWNMWEILYLYGITSLAFSFALLTAEAFQNLHIYLKTGEFEQMLTKPVLPLVQITAASFKVERVSAIIQSLLSLIIAWMNLEIFISVFTITQVIISLVSLFITYYSLFLLNGAFSLVSKDNSEIFNSFIYGGVEVTQYPISIYPKWIQTLFIYFIPLGAASYIPSINILSKKNELEIWFVGSYLIPLLALIFFVISLKCWEMSVKYYKKNGY